MSNAANLPAPSNEHPPTPAEIAARLRTLSDEMYEISVRLQLVPEFELEPDEYGAKAYHMGYEAAREGRTSPGYLMSEGLHMWWSMGFADWLSGRAEKFSN